MLYISNMSKPILSDELKAEINKYLPEALKLKIQDQIKLSQAVKLGSVTTQDGTLTLTFDGDALAMGMSVTVTDATANGAGLPVPATPDTMTYVLSDGSSVSIANGMVTALTPAAPAAPANPPPAVDMSAVNAQLSEHKTSFETKFSALETKYLDALKEITSLKESNKVVLEFIDVLTKTPVEDKPAQTIKKDLKDMTAIERHYYNKNLYK